MAESRAISRVVQAWLWYTFEAATQAWHLFQWLANQVLPRKDRAPRRLPPPRWLSVSADGRLDGLEQLPPLPPLSFEEMAVAFAGCANLCMYSFGVAYALQQAPGSNAVRWHWSGASSGAVVAAPLAMGLSCADVVLNAHQRFVKERMRVGGCIGIYSRSIRGIMQDQIDAARSAGRDVLRAVAGRLSVSVTSFSPGPTHVAVTGFPSEVDIVDTVLASCYIPVAYEDPIVLRGLGFCIDGCVCGFLPNARCVISPYHCNLADVGPATEYPGTLVFNLLHGDDVLRLFEDGYLDCLRWLDNGAPSNCSERDASSSAVGKSFRALVWQGFRVFLSIAGIKDPNKRA
eukprot:CAMPEP_0117518616 /NCGR_PEP_ID=MMETSP0784-20121206/32223_1 /TAXON_ID=39447 /ORGANISM="" /LENGTH=344 /DNA_ID=CAMNT_0005314541 /DNA_START=15 /DNA_END=1049 /DNA_ORIENTATION=+